MADNSGIKLFEHNKTAYISAVKMLSETGKAAVIHPTGTGKSFIAFKLCEDNINKKICWLSPSEYIFKTQCENLSATGVAVPSNIAFFTYAKLMLMADSEISEIKPDYIILDEFHRCGAEMWGKGVENLLKTYPDTPVLGLSATAIRYLDNRRDMSDELFDGNVASEMTLGEAIVRGILNPPKYVLSVYGYRKELEKYKKEHGNLKIPADYVDDGVWLARWLSEQRSRLNGRPTGRNKTVKKLTEEQEEKLISLGVVKKTANAGFIDDKSATEGKMYGEI